MTRYRYVSVGDVLSQVERSEPVDPSKPYDLLGVRWYGEGLFVRESRLGAEIAAVKLNAVQEGDFIYNRLFAWKGSFALARSGDDGGHVSNEFPIFRVDLRRLDPRFLMYFFRQPAVWQAVLERSAGGTPTSRNRLKEDRFLALTMPLPDLDEQRRVAGLLDSVFERIGQALHLRTTSRSMFQGLQDSLIARAFHGVASGPRLPISAFAEVRGGIQKTRDRIPISNPVRYLTVAHVGRNAISLDDPRFFEVAPDELERWRLLAGDVLIIEGNGSPTQIGRTALFRGEIDPCVHQNHVIRIRTDGTVAPEFLNAFLNSPQGQGEVQSRGRTTSGLLSLSVGRIQGIEVPAPPLEVQQRVVAEVDAARQQGELLMRSAEGSHRHLESLQPAILNRAFAGEL